MKRLLFLLFFWANLAFSQNNPTIGTITTSGSDCSTATNCVSMALPANAGGASLTLTGTFTGTVQFEVSANSGASWVSATGSTPANATATSATAVGTWVFPTSGLTNIRARASALASGTVNVTLQSSPATSSGALSLGANQSVNVAQVNGVTTSTGTGAVGTGSQRIAVGQDTTTIAGSAPGTAGTASANVLSVQGIAGMTKLLVTPDALPANQSVNLAQVGGANTAAAAALADATANPTTATFGSDNSVWNGSNWDRWREGAFAGSASVTGVLTGAQSYATANLVNSTPNFSGGQIIVGGTIAPSVQMTAAVAIDPCQSSAVAKSSAIVNFSSATTTQIVAAVSSKQIYVCHVDFTMVGAAETIKFVQGTKVTNDCDTSQVALTGAYADGTASDIIVSLGWGGTVFATTVANSQLCGVTTGTVSIQGVLTYVQQ